MVTSCATDSWDLDEPAQPITLGEIRAALIEESGFRTSIVNRGISRLNDVEATSDTRYAVAGRPEFNDEYPVYTVTFTDGKYQCTCYTHYRGEHRQHRICSHVVAVIVARRLTEVKAQEKPVEPQLTPASLDLPAKFPKFWPSQLLALEKIEASVKRFVILQAPTGAGKSLIVAAAQKLLETRFLYTCTTKQLQAQFVGDFSHGLSGKRYAVELKGRSNYPTLQNKHLFPRINASMCTGQKETHCRWCCDGGCNPNGIRNSAGDIICFTKSKCPYRVQKAKILGSDLGVVNTALFLNEANFVGGLSGWPWVAFDECDQLESSLMSHVELTITKRWIDRLGLQPPARKTVEESWINWARDEAKPKIDEELYKLQSQYGVEDMRKQQELERMKSKVEFFLREVEATKWVFLPSDGHWTFKPVFVSRYANDQLWKHAERFILMSATIISLDEMSHSLGIPREEIDFVDLPSTFPPERRQIHFVPSANITKKTEMVERGKAIVALDKILDNHPQDKVLVHTVSYGFASLTISTSRHKSRMITYDQAKDRESKLDEFKQAPGGTVLVASSMDRGVDLPNDLCRVVVVMKFPYLNLGDKQISTRLYSDKKGGQLWFVVSAIRTLVQMTGRAMRSAEDYCEIYILDTQFERVYKQNRYLFPECWRQALHMKP